MLEEILELQGKIGLSQGEMLDIARKITADDSLRTIDRLSDSERKTMLAMLLKIQDYELCGVA